MILVKINRFCKPLTNAAFPIFLVMTLVLMYITFFYANKDKNHKRVPDDILQSMYQFEEGTMPELNQKMINNPQESAKLTQLPHIKQTLKSTPKPSTAKRLSTKTMAKLVHLDLKGAAPTVGYLKQIVPLLKKWGATGLLIEYEDMFPYSGDLKVLTRPTAYTIKEITTILKLAKDNGLVVIPLVQTFGNMEFVLKHKEFKHLQEDSSNKRVINCLKPEAFEVIQKMIDQVMAAHPQSTLLHIGSHTVSSLGASTESKKFIKANNANTVDLFIKHVETVAAYIKEKHPQIHRSIIWHDGMKSATLSQLKKSLLPSLVEPMVWAYDKNAWDSMVPGTWDNLAKAFPDIWVASTLKAAKDNRNIVVPIQQSLDNNLSWMKAVDEHLSGMFKRIHGFALIGWPGDQHFNPLCELLPVALPSLALNLQLLNYGTFDHSVLKKAGDALKCNGSLELTFKDSKTRCLFPGSAIFEAALRLRSVKNLYSKVMQNNTNEPHKLLLQIHKELNALEIIFHTELKKVFHAETEKEFIEFHVASLKRSLTEHFQKSQKPKAHTKATPKSTPKS